MKSEYVFIVLSTLFLVLSTLYIVKTVSEYEELEIQVVDRNEFGHRTDEHTKRFNREYARTL